VVHGHLKGDRNYTNEIHKMLTLEIIHRLFLDESKRGMGGRSELPTAAEARVS
jgi:hypothetical protein